MELRLQMNNTLAQRKWNGRACFRLWTRLWVVSCCRRHIRITTRTQQTLMLLIISELTQNRIWISECIYELYVYIFNPYPILVRSAYYYVAKCWRAPRTCLQSWQTTQSRDLLFMYMRCVPYNLHYWLCLSPHPKPPGRWRKMIYCTSIMKENRYLKISSFMWTQAYS